ncbi:hypothetical protein C8R45DRAFT_1164037, partial [Mycena sanguinolenta]
LSVSFLDHHLLCWFVPATPLLRPSANTTLRSKYMPTMALLLSNLAPDVIFSIFAHCDISSVVSASQTCRYLHDLALHKSVWLNVLDNLRRRSILDRTSNLEDLSVAEMTGIVQRLITGPKTWSPGKLDPDPVAEISKTITLHRQTDAGKPVDLSDSAKLLPSGRYNVASDRLVWRHPPAIEHTVLVTFGAEETGSESAIIMICLSEVGGGMLFIEIVNVDLGTGTHNCLLAARVPYSGFIDDPVICGALAAVRLTLGYMIINWREKSYFIIGGDNWDFRFALIPRHIVVLEWSGPRPQVHLISNDTIGNLFSPTDDVAELSAVLVEEMAKLHTFHDIATEPVGPDDVYLGMQIHASPVRDADYRVWIRGTSDGLVSYQLSIPDNREPQWRQRNTLPEAGVASYSGHVISYAGFGRGWTVISPDPLAANPGFRLFRDSVVLDLATFWGNYMSHTRINYRDPILSMKSYISVRRGLCFLRI